jgi:hypothetical protein
LYKLLLLCHPRLSAAPLSTSQLLRASVAVGHQGGQTAVTQGVASLGDGVVARIVKIIEDYDDFSEADDPYGEHDFGSCEIDGQKIFWKIDYYDLALSMHSPDPSDPAVTKRVITIMLAQEY